MIIIPQCCRCTCQACGCCPARSSSIKCVLLHCINFKGVTASGHFLQRHTHLLTYDASRTCICLLHNVKHTSAVWYSVITVLDCSPFCPISGVNALDTSSRAAPQSMVVTIVTLYSVAIYGNGNGGTSSSDKGSSSQQHMLTQCNYESNLQPLFWAKGGVSINQQLASGVCLFTSLLAVFYLFSLHMSEC